MIWFGLVWFGLMFLIEIEIDGRGRGNKVGTVAGVAQVVWRRVVMDDGVVVAILGV